MRKIIVLLTLSFCIIGLTAFSTASTSLVNATIVNYSINMNGYEITKDFDNSILSYEERTFISVRDVARAFNKNVSWDSESKVITLTDTNKDEPVVWDNNTALMIGKAIIGQFFPDKVNDKTIYEVGTVQVDLNSTKPIFGVFAIFNPNSSIDENNIFSYIDAVVEIEPSTGAIITVSKYTDGKHIYLFP